MTRRLGMLIAALAVAAFGIAGVRALHEARLERRLLEADPDLLPGLAELNDPAVDRGRSAFRQHCAVCHGADGTGNSAAGVPDLSDADWLYGNGTVAEIERTIAFGIRSYDPKGANLALMPGYAAPRANPAAPSSLSPPQIADVVEFLIKLRGGVVDAAAAARGAAVYGNQGGCYDCHGQDARGDGAIGAPDLTDHATLYGDDRRALFRSIAYGRRGSCPGWRRSLGALHIREVALYVH